MTSTHDAKPVPCHFCKADQVITMPNDRAKWGGEMGHPNADAFYCHCEGCGADGPVGDFHNEAVTLWNGPALPVQTHDADTVERAAAILDSMRDCCGLDQDGNSYIDEEMHLFAVNALGEAAIAIRSLPTTPPQEVSVPTHWMVSGCMAWRESTYSKEADKHGTCGLVAFTPDRT